MTLKLNNNTGVLTARHFNQIKDMLCALNTVECDIAGAFYDIDGVEHYQFCHTLIELMEDCCEYVPSPQTHYYYSSGDVARGLTKATINNLYGIGASISGATPPVSYDPIAMCEGQSGLDDRYIGISGARQTGLSGITGDNIIGTTIDITAAVGLNTVEPNNNNAYPVYTYCKVPMRPCVLLQLEALPLGASITKAIAKITLTNPVCYLQEVTTTADDSGLHSSYSQTELPSPLLGVFLVGHIPDASPVILASGGVTTAGEGTQTIDLNITDAAQKYLAAIQTGTTLYHNITLAVVPVASESIIEQDGVALMDGLGLATCGAEFSTWEHPDSPCKGKLHYCSYQWATRIEFASYLLNSVHIEFALPSMNTLRVPIGNLPKFKD
ncbi:MAG TPA: hypothetical protein PLE18_13680 [Candidatus Sumerlaeota bacterium]|nr:hypothetical protein [Candidatus Sumerlaeota bacterium]